MYLFNYFFNEASARGLYHIASCSQWTLSSKMMWFPILYVKLDVNLNLGNSRHLGKVAISLRSSFSFSFSFRAQLLARGCVLYPSDLANLLCNYLSSRRAGVLYPSDLANLLCNSSYLSSDGARAGVLHPSDLANLLCNSSYLMPIKKTKKKQRRSPKTVVTFYRTKVSELNLSLADNFVPRRRRANLMPFLTSYVEQYNSLELELMLNLSFADNFVPGHCRANLMPFWTSYRTKVAELMLKIVSELMLIYLYLFLYE